jgi:hypothetical protein
MLTAENMFCHPCIECLLCFFFIDSSCFRHRRQRTEKERQEEETSALSPFQRVLAERARRLEEVSFWNMNIIMFSRSVVEPKLLFFRLRLRGAANPNSGFSSGPGSG